MATVIRVKNADWSGLGLPNLFPYVAKDAVEFFYDLGSSGADLSDRSGQLGAIVPYRNDIVGGQSHVQDSSVMVGIDGGAGVRVELGYLLTGAPITDIPIDGSMQFTIMVVGGYSGEIFPAAKKIAGEPSLCNLYDHGTAITPKGFSMQTVKAEGFGARIKSSTPVLGPLALNSKGFRFLTFDGANWTIYDKTAGTSDSKTNAELGIVATIPADSAVLPNSAVGHFHQSSTLAALYPSIYQLGRWGRVLTTEEMDLQIEKTKIAKPVLA